HSSDRNPIFLFHCYGDTRHLHSFPTRRSSDLALGSKIKEVHLSSSIGVDPQLFSFLEEGDNRVQTPAYRLDAANVLSPSSCPEGKVYINSRQYFGFVPEAVWRYKLLDVQPDHVWL